MVWKLMVAPEFVLVQHQSLDLPPLPGLEQIMLARDVDGGCHIPEQ